MTKQEKAGHIYDTYMEIYEDTVDWREKRDRCVKAYLGNQWETSVAERLRSRGQIDVVINIIRVLLRNRVSSMVAQKPTGDIFGVGKGDMHIVPFLKDILDYHWYQSGGQSVAERVTMSQQREGVGYFVVLPDYKADYGLGELRVYDEIWRHVWVRKTAGRMWDWSDAPEIILSKLLTERQFYDLEPGYKGKLTPDYFQANDEIYWSGQREHEESNEVHLPEVTQEQSFVRVFDVFEKFYKEIPILRVIPTGTVEVKDENYTPTNEENDLIAQGVMEFVSAPVPRIRYKKSYGDKILREETVLPIEHYPVVPVVNEDTGNVMPLGEIDQTFGMQELLNKFFSIVVHNAALASNPRIWIDAARAGVKDLKSLENQLASPGAIIDIQTDPQGKFPVEFQKPDPLNPAFYPLFERMIGLLQFGTATFSSKMGDTSQAPDTFSATLQYGEWQQDNLRIPLSRLEMGIQRVFNILLEWMPNFYTEQKVFDIIRDNGQIDQVVLNEQAYMDETWKTLNDIRNIRARYRIKMGSTMPASSVAYMNFFKELAQTHPLFLKYLIDYTPIKEKMQVKKEIDLVQQLQGQLQESQKSNNVLEGMVTNLLRERAESQMSDMVADTKRKLESIEDKAKLELKKKGSSK
jgi:hypothetical protein